MFKKKKFLIGGAVLILAIAYLAYTGFVSSATYYYTVTEFTQTASPANSQVVRVSGEVAGGSVVQNGSSLRFDLVDGSNRLAVAYEGVVPDTFKPGVEIVVEGKLDPGNIFQAKSILTKCASKYVPG